MPNFQDLGIPDNILPPEYANGLLDNLDKRYSTMEDAQTKNVLDSQEEKGLFRSGDTEKQLVSQVLGPSIDRRQQALYGLVGQGVNQMTADRTATTQFNRQEQMSQEEWQRRLQEMSIDLEHQKQLLELKNSFTPGFGTNLETSLANGLGKSATSWLDASNYKKSPSQG